MNDETLNYANRIRSEIGVVEMMLNRIEKKEAVVDITLAIMAAAHVKATISQMMR